MRSKGDQLLVVAPQVQFDAVTQMQNPSLVQTCAQVGPWAGMREPSSSLPVGVSLSTAQSHEEEGRQMQIG